MMWSLNPGKSQTFSSNL